MWESCATSAYPDTCSPSPPSNTQVPRVHTASAFPCLSSLANRNLSNTIRHSVLRNMLGAMRSNEAGVTNYFCDMQNVVFTYAMLVYYTAHFHICLGLSEHAGVVVCGNLIVNLSSYLSEHHECL